MYESNTTEGTVFVNFTRRLNEHSLYGERGSCGADMIMDRGSRRSFECPDGHLHSAHPSFFACGVYDTWPDQARRRYFRVVQFSARSG